MADKLLVTGGNGFIASWLVHLALQRGLRVRATVRKNTPEKVKCLMQLPGAKERLEIAELDLAKGTPEDFQRAVAGCTLVAHTASPFVVSVKDEQELIKPAVEGTLGVLRAVASDAGASVRAVVVTASVASIAAGWSHADMDAHGPFGEKDWSKVETAEPYPKSKTLAEKAAWDFYASLGDNPRFSLSTIHPSLVEGPAITPERGTSVDLMRRLLTREVPLCPAIGFNVVDVRDVAEAHLRVLLDNPRDAVNKRRFLITNAPLTFLEMAKILASEFNKYGFHPPTSPMPKFLAQLLSFFIVDLNAVLHDWGRPRTPFDNAPSKEILKIEYHDAVEAVKLAGHSLIFHGLVKKPAGYAYQWVPPGASA